MLVYNTMRFGTDVLTATDSSDGVGVRKAMLTAYLTLNASGAQAISFSISGSEPAGTARRFMFKADDKIYRAVSGALTEYTKDTTVDNVLADGNTAAEITALSDIYAFAGKELYLLIALSSTVDDNPTAKFSYTITQSAAQKTCTTNTAIFVLPIADDNDTPVITSIDVTKETAGAGAINVMTRLENAEGVWSDWITPEQAVNQEATRIQFQFQASVENGGDSAAVKNIIVNYVTKSDIVTGAAAEIYSVVPNFENDLRLCYLIVRHKQLIDSTIEAFANFLPAYKSRERISVGTGKGSAQQYTLGVSGTADRQIDQSSIRVFVDGNEIDDFDYDTGTGKITVNATSGVSILASYNYGCGQEDWKAMTAEAQQPYGDGTYMTRFTYTLPDGEDAQRANIRIRLNRPAGTVTNASLGKATGKTQQIALPHLATPSSIVCNADWTYEFDSRILTFVASKNTALKISYDYVGEQHQIYSWAAGWAAAS